MTSITSIILDGAAVAKAALRNWLKGPEFEEQVTCDGGDVSGAGTTPPGPLVISTISTTSLALNFGINATGGHAWLQARDLLAASYYTLFLNPIGGNVAIGHGTTASGANAYIDSTTKVISRSTSSIRYKTDVEELPDEEGDRILQLRPITYRSNADLDDPDKVHIGLIAEEVAEVEPRLVEYSVDEEGEPRPESVNYARLCVQLISVVKRLESRLAALETA